jgi:hypothetical protein
MGSHPREERAQEPPYRDVGWVYTTRNFLGSIFPGGDNQRSEEQSWEVTSLNAVETECLPRREKPVKLPMKKGLVLG